jgi:hypothetical protein
MTAAFSTQPTWPTSPATAMKSGMALASTCPSGPGGGIVPFVPVRGKVLQAQTTTKMARRIAADTMRRIDFMLSQRR